MEKPVIDVYIEIAGGVLQSVYVDKASDKKYNVCVTKIDYDDLHNGADEEPYKQFEKQVKAKKLVAIY